MGVSSSKENKDKESNESLTPNDVQLIKNSWETIQDKDNFGLRLMIRMFNNDSEIKYLWIFASNLETEEEMLNNSELRYHAKKVINVLAKILASLTDENAEKVDLVRLGRRHHGYGMLKDHFKFFEDCFIQCLEKIIKNKTIMNDNTKKAWRKAIRFIFSQFEIGLNIEIKEIEEQEEKQKQNNTKKINNKNNH